MKKVLQARILVLTDQILDDNATRIEDEIDKANKHLERERLQKLLAALLHDEMQKSSAAGKF